MKNIIYLIFFIVLFSSSAKKQENIKSVLLIKNTENNLTEVESNIVNDFIDAELKKERYKKYKDYEIVVIEEAFKKIKSIESYLYSYNKRHPINKSYNWEDVDDVYFLDSLQIKKSTYLHKKHLYLQ